MAGNGICGFNTPEGLNYPAISADGRFVTFASNSTNLVPGAGTNTSGSGNNVVYVKDMVTGAIDVASQLTVDSVDPSISADGGFVSFTNNSVGATSPATRPRVKSTSPTIRCPATSRSRSAVHWSRAPPTTR